MNQRKATATVTPITPGAAASAAPKRKRDRKRGPQAPQASPVAAAELCSARIDELLTAVRGRATDLIEGQRSKPTRWDYFAALTELENRLRTVIGT